MDYLISKLPYLLGFAIIEAGIYYFNGPKGNFTTGFLGIFAIWLYYSLMTRHRPERQRRPGGLP